MPGGLEPPFASPSIPLRCPKEHLPWWTPPPQRPESQPLPLPFLFPSPPPSSSSTDQPPPPTTPLHQPCNSSLDHGMPSMPYPTPLPWSRNTSSPSFHRNCMTPSSTIHWVPCSIRYNPTVSMISIPLSQPRFFDPSTFSDSALAAVHLLLLHLFPLVLSQYQGHLPLFLCFLPLLVSLNPFLFCNSCLLC